MQLTQWLSLNDIELTNAGLLRLRNLAQLRNLQHRNTQVTDAGLEYLRGLSQLQDLHLRNTQVTKTESAATTR